VKSTLYLVHDTLARVALADRVVCRRVEAQGHQPCARCAKARAPRGDGGHCPLPRARQGALAPRAVREHV
jgi:hypothetical protein